MCVKSEFFPKSVLAAWAISTQRSRWPQLLTADHGSRSDPPHYLPCSFHEARAMRAAAARVLGTYEYGRQCGDGS